MELMVYFDICSAMVGSSKPCELWPPMWTVLCGSLISGPHNMVKIPLFAWYYFWNMFLAWTCSPVQRLIIMRCQLMLFTYFQWGGRHRTFTAWEIQVGSLILVAKQVSPMEYLKYHIHMLYWNYCSYINLPVYELWCIMNVWTILGKQKLDR